MHSPHLGVCDKLRAENLRNPKDSSLTLSRSVQFSVIDTHWLLIGSSSIDIVDHGVCGRNDRRDVGNHRTLYYLGDRRDRLIMIIRYRS